MKTAAVLIRHLFLFLAFLVSIESIDYTPCPYSNTHEDRILFVATCDTRVAWKEFKALQPWNITSQDLRVGTGGQVSMLNVCKNGNWGKLGFLTKPLTYIGYLKKLMTDTHNAAMLDKVYVILMDSDTFWSVANIKHIWNRFDCARNKKKVVLSTEMSCWVGRYCQAADLARWYSHPELTPSYSPFANSGVIMGQIESVAKMLEYVIVNNASYWTHYGRKYKFDDQYAIADYAITVAPQEVQLDYHQQIAGSFSMHPSPLPVEEGWPFMCKNRTGSYNSCPDKTKMLWRRFNYFKLNKTSCLIYRSVESYTPFAEELNSLSSDPLVWHGNGAGKEVFRNKAYESMQCFLEQRKITSEEYDQTMFSG